MRKVVVITILAGITSPLWGGRALAWAGQVADTIHGSYMQTVLTGGFIGCF